MLLLHLFSLSISILQYFLLLWGGVLKLEVFTSLHPLFFGFFRKGLPFFFPSLLSIYSFLSLLDPNLNSRNLNLHKS